jgi:hypothetical protein
MHARNLEGERPVSRPGIEERIIRMGVKEMGSEDVDWIGFIWLRAGCSNGLS